MDWDEDNVNWNNCPIKSNITTNSSVPVSYGWIDWDVTSDIEDFLDGSFPNYGWKIYDSYEWDDVDIPVIKFYTKEHCSLIPCLEIEIVQ